MGTNLNPIFQEYNSIHGGDYYYYDIDCRTRSSIRFVASFDYDGDECDDDGYDGDVVGVDDGGV